MSLFGAEDGLYKKSEEKNGSSTFSFGRVKNPSLGAASAASVQPVFSTTLSKDADSKVKNISSTERKEPAHQFTFLGGQARLDSPWRNMVWTEERKTGLMETISSYRPSCGEVPQARVLLLGPVSSGKSSFISSVQSVFNGRVTNRAMVGSYSTSFTKKLQSFKIRGQKREDHSGLVLCDIMGLGDDGMTGLTLHDILSVIKGHVPEGHKRPSRPMPSQSFTQSHWSQILSENLRPWSHHPSIIDPSIHRSIHPSIHPSITLLTFTLEPQNIKVKHLAHYLKDCQERCSPSISFTCFILSH